MKPTNATAGKAGEGDVGASLGIPELPVTFSTLPNGLELIVREERSAPVASVQVWCRSGSIHEGAWLGGGVSHFVEHMLFKGTSRRHYSEIAAEVQGLGGYVNAYTSFDRTVYWVDCPSAGTAGALDILLDVARDSQFPEEEFAKEQEVIRREFAMGEDDPGGALGELLFSTAFRKHPYRLPVIGHLDMFNQLSRDDLFGYYRARYSPDQLFVVVVGDVDAAAIHEQVSAACEGWGRVASAPPLVPVEPPQLGRREADQPFLTEVGRCAVAWHIPSLTDPEIPALDVLSTVLGTGRSSRFNTSLRDREKLAHSTYSYLFSQAEGGLFVAGGESEPTDLTGLTEGLIREAEKAQDTGVSEEEVEKARRITLADMVDNLTTMRGQASDLGQSWLTTSSMQFTSSYLERLQAVTCDDVQEVAQKYLLPERQTRVGLHPKGQSSTVAGATLTKSVPRLVRETLEGGSLPLIVREDHRLPLVSIYATFRGGVLSESSEKAGIALLASRLMIKGAGNRSSEEIATLIEGGGGSISGASGNNSVAVEIEVLRDDFEKAVDVLADILNAPTMPEDALEVERAAQIARIRENEDKPMAVAMDVLRRELFGEHPLSWSAVGTEAGIAKLSRDDLLQHNAKQVVQSNGAITVFGDVDAEEVKKALSGRLGGLPTGEATLSPPPVLGALSDDLKSPHRIQLDREQAVLMVGYRGVSLGSEDRLAMELIDEACSDMSSPLFVRIREEMGLAYYVGAGQRVTLSGGAFYFYVGTAPEELEAVEAALLEEIQKIAESGIAPADLERAKASYLGKDLVHNQSGAALGQVVALDELYGFGHEHFLELSDRVAEVTPEKVASVAQRYFLGKPRVVVSVAP